MRRKMNGCALIAAGVGLVLVLAVFCLLAVGVGLFLSPAIQHQQIQYIPVVVTMVATSQVQPTQTAVPGEATKDVLCKEAPPSRLVPGEKAIITMKHNIRSTKVSGAIIVSLDAGEIVAVVEGEKPQCGDNVLWWKVQTGGGIIGWTAEGRGSNRYLIPVPKK